MSETNILDPMALWGVEMTTAEMWALIMSAHAMRQALDAIRAEAASVTDGLDQSWPSGPWHVASYVPPCDNPETTCRIIQAGGAGIGEGYNSKDEYLSVSGIMNSSTAELIARAPSLFLTLKKAQEAA